MANMIAKNSCTILVSLDFLMCVVGPHCGFNLCFPNDAKHLLMPLFFICMGEVEFGLGGVIIQLFCFYFIGLFSYY